MSRTGGTLQRVRNADEGLAEILTNFRSSYVLRYTPIEAPKPGWHEIKVKVTRPGSYNIRARRGYAATAANQNPHVNQNPHPGTPEPRKPRNPKQR